MTSQKQAGDDGSLTIRGDASPNMGVTCADFVRMLLDVFEANFLRLSEIAQDTARARAEEITEKFFEELKERHPAGIAVAQDPDFQHALFAAQCAHARAGEKGLEAVLVELLVERSKNPERNLCQIVLSEALGVAPRLTAQQLLLLEGVAFIRCPDLLRRLVSLDGLRSLLEWMSGACQDPRDAPSSLEHLRHTGCMTTETTSYYSLQQRLVFGCPWFFTRGFDPTVLDNAVGAEAIRPLLRPSFHVPGNLQVLPEAYDRPEVTALLRSSEGEELTSAFVQHMGTMDAEEVNQCLLGLHPGAADLLEMWSQLRMQHKRLTAVGLVLGNAQCRLRDESAAVSVRELLDRAG
jgi:hypothetical protein